MQLPPARFADTTRAQVFMIIIERMIARYQNRHAGNLDEEMFKLFEKAKRVHYARDRDSLDEAVKDI